MAGIARCVARIHEVGALVKDLDQGLVDFPARAGGRGRAPLLAPRRGRESASGTASKRASRAASRSRRSRSPRSPPWVGRSVHPPPAVEATARRLTRLCRFWAESALAARAEDRPPRRRIERAWSLWQRWLHRRRDHRRRDRPREARRLADVPPRPPARGRHALPRAAPQPDDRDHRVGVLSALLVVPQVRAVAGGPPRLVRHRRPRRRPRRPAPARELRRRRRDRLHPAAAARRPGHVDGVEGTVEEIGLTYTFIKTDDNARLVIPNEKLASDTIRNSTIVSREKLAQVTVQVPLDRDLDAVVDLLKERDGRRSPRRRARHRPERRRRPSPCAPGRRRSEAAETARERPPAPPRTRASASREPAVSPPPPTERPPRRSGADAARAPPPAPPRPRAQRAAGSPSSSFLLVGIAAALARGRASAAPRRSAATAT